MTSWWWARVGRRVLVKFEDIWEQLRRKRPTLDDPGSVVEISSGSMKKLLRQVYDQGRKSAPKNGDTSIFGDFFGER